LFPGPEVFIRLPHSMCVTSVAGVLEVAQAAEQLGFDGVSVQDQLLQSRGTAPCGHYHGGDDRDIFEPLATLSYVAARTSRVKLVTGVIVLPFRHVVQLAKAAGTIDVLSNGRLVLGVGIGWPGARIGDVAQRMSHYAEVARRETELFNVPSPRPKLMDEALQALHLLWTEDVASFHGDLISFEGVDLRPQPVQEPRPPIWVGGRAEAVQRRAALYADGWFPSQATVALVREGRERMLPIAKAAGRPEPRLAVNIFLSVDEDGDAAREVIRDGLGARFKTPEQLADATISGTPAEVTARMREYMAAGVSAFDLKLLPLTTDRMLSTMDVLARDVLPALRST
jgi:probable F420-dependent oxidoreductase